MSAARRSWPTIARALGFAIVLIAVGSAACAEEALIGEGKRLFTEHGCYGCHTVGKTGTPIATDLSRVGARYPQSYLTRWLRDPSERRPTAHMPRIHMTEREVQALAAYLGSLR